MEKIGVNNDGLCILGLYVCFAALLLVLQCDATNTKRPREIHLFKKFDIEDMPLDSSNSDPYITSQFSMAPYDSLSPFSFPENAPPYCVYPPFTPHPPSTIPSPLMDYTPPPLPPEPILPSPTPILFPPSTPTITPSPSAGIVPNPPTYFPTPIQPVLSPPYYEPSPPHNIPPSPRPFLPPIFYPPPTVPPPPQRAQAQAMWCVAKASVPDPIILEAMNYACGSGADCDQIQSSGSCFQPNTLFAHASYAFNSYWQSTKVTGGTCDFGGTALLVTVDPSYDGCHFVYF